MYFESNNSISEQQNITETTAKEYRSSAPINVPRKKSAMFHPGVTRLDRWLVKKMVDVVGNPPVRISLWDGVEVTPRCQNPVAVMVYCDRGALIKTILDPELHWGDLYCSGRVEFEGDMAEFMQAIYLGIRGKGETGWIRKFVLWLGHRTIFNSHDICINLLSLFSSFYPGFHFEFSILPF